MLLVNEMHLWPVSVNYILDKNYKKAVLSQRWPRHAPLRPIYGCSEKFRECLATPTATFPEIVNVLLLRSIVLKCVQNLKFVALPVPEIIRGTLKGRLNARVKETACKRRGIESAGKKPPVKLEVSKTHTYALYTYTVCYIVSECAGESCAKYGEC